VSLLIRGKEEEGATSKRGGRERKDGKGGVGNSPPPSQGQ